VGYADGGLPELVGQCGRLVPPGDRDALAGAIVSLLADESRRRELGGCGRERVAREFTLDRMAEAMRNAYRRAAAT
jgi:glycosyltransferase involved in cell wall biosynthesis